MTFLTANCVNGDVRLVGGSTNREGRVEVCMNGRWGTVCNNNQQLAGTVCSQLGYSGDGKLDKFLKLKVLMICS